MRDFIYIMFWLSNSIAWLHAIIIDANTSNIAWVITDILLPPLGIIRGYFMFFS